VLDATTENFVELVTIAALNPARDFRHLNLKSVDFAACDLAGFDFTGSLLEGARFRGARIAGAIFDRKQRQLPELIAADDYLNTFGRPDWRHSFGGVDALAEGYFHSALMDDIPELRKCLTAGVGVDEEFKIGASFRTALKHIATRTSHYGNERGALGFEGARYLLRAGADPNHAVGPDRWTPLLQAAHEGAVPLVGLFLDFGADPNAANVEGRTPLHGAVESESVQIVQLLLSAGAEPNRKAEIFGTPLEYARSKKLKTIVQLLRRWKADET
jgi:hypothetical protein